MTSKQMSNKYHNMPATVNGIRFASRKEAARYQELMLLQRAGEIRNLKLQPQFTLVEGYRDARTGETVRAMRYVADFAYEEPFRGPDSLTLWRTIVEDVKGKQTTEYKMKRKLMRERGIEIRET